MMMAPREANSGWEFISIVHLGCSMIARRIAVLMGLGEDWLLVFQPVSNRYGLHHQARRTVP